jgi:galactosamine-6-phosphate isomerase
MSDSTPFQFACASDHEAMSQLAVAQIVAQLRTKPDSLLVLATGSTPHRAYQLLADQGRAEQGLCDQMRILKLDEWGGLAMDDPATCEAALRETLIHPLRMGPDRYRAWQSDPPDVNAECGRMARWLREHGPADLCVLGLGINGHLGFNEPNDHLHPHAHRTELSKESMRHSMLHQARTQPAFGLTLGMRDIMSSRNILLLVSGKSKRTQLRRLFQPEISPSFPASFLWLHPRVTVCCDEASQAPPFRVAKTLKYGRKKRCKKRP